VNKPRTQFNKKTEERDQKASHGNFLNDKSTNILLAPKPTEQPNLAD